MEEAVSGSISIFPIQLPGIMKHQTDTPEPAFSIACEQPAPGMRTDFFTIGHDVLNGLP